MKQALNTFNLFCTKELSTFSMTAFVLMLGFSLALPSTAGAQTAADWNGGDGQWTENNWTFTPVIPGTIFPNNDGNVFDVTIKGTGIPLGVILDRAIAINGLSVDRGATFTQNSSTHTITNALLLGAESGSTGTYELSGGNLSTGQTGLGGALFAPGGSGIFRQSGGIHTTKRLNVGDISSEGSYELSGGNLTVGNGEFLLGGTFTQSGGVHTIVSGLDVTGFIGTPSYKLSGGSLTVGGGESFLDGSFTQSDGTHTIANDLTLGFVGGDSAFKEAGGSFELRGGSLTVGRSTKLNSRRGGIFTQGGGTHTVTNNLLVGVSPGGTGGVDGIYLLNGGRLEVLGSTRVGATDMVGGTFTQSGGTHIIAKTLTVGEQGSYMASGGTLAAKDIVNDSVFAYTGGVIKGLDSEPASFTNNDRLTIESVTGENLIIDGQVINTGRVNIVGGSTRVEFTDTFTNERAYDSTTTQGTGSESIFRDDLIIGEVGYLIGGRRDHFIIEGNLKSNSQESGLWNTLDASLTFMGPSEHEFFLTGEDMGDSFLGFGQDNFGWNRLSLESEGFLKLVDATDPTDEFNGALYTKILDLPVAAGIATNEIRTIIQNTFIVDLQNTFMGKGLNIYYDASLAPNDFLGGLEYALGGTLGGKLVPVSSAPASVPAPVPEPGTLSLLAIGFLALLVLRRTGY